jgi:hypothetical protein
VSRETKSGGFVDIPRVRLSILGAIPPDTLQQKTSRADWRSGFMPRFTLWGARRDRYMDLPGEDFETEEELGRWMKAICWAYDSPIVIPQGPAKIITDWVRKEVEEKRDAYPSDVFSALVRLQEKGFRIAGMFATSAIGTIGEEAIQVKKNHAKLAVRVLKELKQTTISMFNLIGADQQSTEERLVIEAIAATEGINLEGLLEACGLSRYRIQRILLTYMDEGMIFAQDLPSTGVGRPKKAYFLR